MNLLFVETNKTGRAALAAAICMRRRGELSIYQGILARSTIIRPMNGGINKYLLEYIEEKNKNKVNKVQLADHIGLSEGLIKRTDTIYTFNRYEKDYLLGEYSNHKGNNLIFRNR